MLWYEIRFPTSANNFSKSRLLTSEDSVKVFASLRRPSVEDISDFNLMRELWTCGDIFRSSGYESLNHVPLSSADRTVVLWWHSCSKASWMVKVKAGVRGAGVIRAILKREYYVLERLSFFKIWYIASLACTLPIFWRIFPLKAEIWTFLYSAQIETGVIKAGVKGARVKLGPAL